MTFRIATSNLIKVRVSELSNSFPLTNEILGLREVFRLSADFTSFPLTMFERHYNVELRTFYYQITYTYKMSLTGTTITGEIIWNDRLLDSKRIDIIDAARVSGARI